MIALPVTSLFAGIFALAFVPLSLQVTMRRVKVRARFGNAGDEVLLRRIRAHGNFIESVPLALILLALVEYGGAGSLLVWGLGATFLFSRLIHAFGVLYTPTPKLQALAMTMQFVGFIAAAAWLARQSISLL